MRRAAFRLATLILASAPLSAGDAAPICPPEEHDAVGLLACGEQAIDRGKLKKAEGLLDRAFEAAAAKLPRTGTYIRVVGQQARLAREQGDEQAAAEVYRRALARLDPRVPTDDPFRINLMMLQAEAFQFNDPLAAIALAKQALAIAESSSDSEPGEKRLARTLRRLGFLQLKERRAEALATFEQVVELCDWEPDPLLLMLVETLARDAAEAGRVDEAGRYYKLAIATWRAHRGPGNPTSDQLLDELTELSRRHDRPDLVAWVGEPDGPRGRSLTSPARRLDRVAPAYPEKARRKRVEGRVVLRLQVLEDGTVGEVDVVRCSNPGFGFEEAARDAAAQWTYEPAIRDGEPVESRVTAVHQFTLN